MQIYNEHTILTYKDIADLTGFSPTYSAKVLTEIKKEYGVKRVTYKKFTAYFG